MENLSASAAGLFEQLRCLRGDFEQRKACRASCTVDTCPLVLSYWGYRPHVPTNAAFLAIFAVYLILVLVPGIWTRRFKKYTTMMFIGSALEIIGYVARIYAYNYPFSDLSFITQLTTLTLAPAFYAAAIYFSLARIVVTFGEEYSRISARRIPKVFISCDIVSLILQGAGGAWAAYLAQREKMPTKGNYTMIAGLSFQALTLLTFLTLSADFALRTWKGVRHGGSSALSDDDMSRRLRNSKRFKALIISLTVSAVLIFMRSVYRVAELAQGWKGELMTTEKFVIVLEAVPVTIAGLLLSVFHPAICFPEDKSAGAAAAPQGPFDESPSTAGSNDPNDAEKYNNNRHGNMTVTYDPTFDRRRWR